MEKIKFLLFSLFGTMLTGMGIGIFLTPNKVVGGGVSGLSTILFHTLKIPIGLSFFVMNCLLLVVGLKLLGKIFVKKTLWGVTLLSLFTQVFSYFPVHMNDIMLASIFGGVLYGVGIGISFASGASTGGTDILGRIVQKKLSFVPIGKMLLLIDGIIILVSLVIFKNVELTLYGAVALFVSSISIDFIIGKLNASRMVFVITDRGQEISQKLVSTSPRGVTLINVKGVYSDKEKQMLFCVLKENEVEEFQNKILLIDAEAFIVFSESQKIKGNGFLLYK